MIRIDNLKLLMQQQGLTKADCARQLGTSDTYVSKLLSGKPGTFGEKAARRVEESFKKPRFWLDAMHRDGVYSPDTTQEISQSPSVLRESPALYRVGNSAVFVTEPFSDNLLPVIKWEQVEMLEKENLTFSAGEVEMAPAGGFSYTNSKWIKMDDADDSMIGVFPPGTMLRVDLVSDGATTSPGKFVIVLDQDNAHHVRRFKQVSRTHFLAEPMNAGYATLDSQRDQLRVVAIVRQALIDM